jgi:hypothetical protein
MICEHDSLWKSSPQSSRLVFGLQAGDDGTARPSQEDRPEMSDPAPKRRRSWIHGLRVYIALAVVWLLTAYLVLPALWRHYEHYPVLSDAPKTTVTAQGIPGDPLNVGLIGAEDDVVRSTLRGLEPGRTGHVPEQTPHRPQRGARAALPRGAGERPLPVRAETRLAFQKAVGNSARRRHHVRFWRSPELGRQGVPPWIGAVTFDRSVGLSHRTGQITHHIGPDIDAERLGLITVLHRAGRLARIFQVTGVGATLAGRNGGGDLDFTDGEPTVGVLAAEVSPVNRPDRLPNPVAVQLKEQLWPAIRPLHRATESSP